MDVVMISGLVLGFCHSYFGSAFNSGHLFSVGIGLSLLFGFAFGIGNALDT